jgi:hypothetical protein
LPPRGGNYSRDGQMSVSLKPGTEAAKLLASIAAFQRSRPDLPQGEIDTLSKRDVSKVVDAFELERHRPTLEKLEGAARREYAKILRIKLPPELKD